jgi:hypothetical protein
MKSIVASAFFLLAVFVGKGLAQDRPTLMLPNMSAQVGDTVLVSIKAVNFDTLATFQFSVSWDSSIVSYLGTEDYYFPSLALNSFNVSKVGQGKLGILWTANPGAPESVADSAIVFSIRAVVVGAGDSEMAFSDSPLAIELSYFDGSVLEADDMVLVSGTVSATDPSTAVQWAESNGLSLYQNEPNPFREATHIPFTLPEAGRSSLTVFDLMGRKVAYFEDVFRAGDAYFRLEGRCLPSPGVYAYTLRAGRSALSGKVLYIE